MSYFASCYSTKEQHTSAHNYDSLFSPEDATNIKNFILRNRGTQREYSSKPLKDQYFSIKTVDIGIF